MKKLLTLALLLSAVVLSGCGLGGDLSDEQKVEAIAFQSEKDGNWGLISTDGKVIFADEFKTAPTSLINGRFFYENEKGEVEIYKFDEKPQQVGEAFKAVCPFFEDVTPAVQKGKPIALIDRDGKEVKSLAKIGGKSVAKVAAFHDGVALFETADGSMGTINPKGDIVSEAKYYAMMYAGKGLIIALEKKYEEAAKNGETDKLKYSILEAKSGKIVSTLDGKKYNIQSAASGRFIVTEKNGDDDAKWGIIDEKGEWLVKVTTKYEGIWACNEKYFIFQKDDLRGVATYDGEVKIRAKYDGLRLTTDENTFIAYSEKKDENDCAMLVNIDGEQVSEEKYRNIYAAQGADGNFPVQISENEYGFMDAKGKTIKLDKNVDLYDISLSQGSSYVESDYVDAAALVQSLNITASSIDGVSLGAVAQPTIKALGARYGVSTDPDEHVTSYVSYWKEIKPAVCGISVSFTGYIAEMKYTTRTEDWGWGYTYSYQVPDDYGYNASSTVDGIHASFNNDGKLEGKTDLIYKALKSKISGLGKVYKSDTHYTVIDLGGGKMIAAYDTGERATVSLLKQAPSGFYYPGYEGKGGSAVSSEADSCAVDYDYADSTAAPYA